MILYTVVIVNYRTEEYVRRAVESVEASASVDNFRVVVVNNGSASPANATLLRKLESQHTWVVEANVNRGFACGNNLGIRLAVDEYHPEFVVIMNPDVEVVHHGTIERLINRVRNADSSVAGAQPLVDNYRLTTNPAKAFQIRRVPSVWDLVIADSLILRPLFRRRFRRFLMMDSMPYMTLVPFSVPSGAFFLLRAADFSVIDYFDEGTFLYGEELILGEKLRRIGKHMILEPNERVRHFQGASTSSGRGHAPNRRMHRIRCQSEQYFVRKYLGANRFHLFVLKLALEVGYIVRIAAWLGSQGLKSLAILLPQAR